MGDISKPKAMKSASPLLDEERIDFCREIMQQAEAKGVKLLLPVDVVIANEFAADAEHKVVAADYLS